MRRTAGAASSGSSTVAEGAQSTTKRGRVRRDLPGAPRLPAVSASAVLLALGAICVFVAAVVFVSVAWSDLSLAIRAAILLAVTLGVGVVANWALHKLLRGSAEAFASLSVFLTVLDFVAARHGDLVGLGALSSSATGWVAGSLLLISGTTWALAGARSDLRSLRAVQVLAALGLGYLVTRAFDQWHGRHEYVALLALAATSLVSGLAAKLGLKLLAKAAAMVSGLTFCLALALSLSRLLGAGTLHVLWVRGNVYGWVICCVVFAAASTLRFLPRIGRVVASAAALAGLAAALLRPLEGAGTDVILSVFAGVALLLALAVPVLGAVWGSGARLAATAPGAVALVALVPPLGVAVMKGLSAAAGHWTRTPAYHPRALSLHSDAHPAVVALAVLTLGAAGVLIALGRRPTVIDGILIGESAAAVGVLNANVPLVAVVVLLLVLGVAAGLSGLLGRSGRAGTASVGWAASSLVVSLASDLLTALTSLVLFAFAALMVGRLVRRLHCTICAAAAVWLLSLSVAAWTHVGGGGAVAQGLGLVTLAVAAALFGQISLGGTSLPYRVGTERAAVPVAVVGLVLCGTDPVALQLALTVTGVAAIIVSLASSDRRPVSVSGGLLLAAASWSRLNEENVTVVEAYTLPSALVLIGAGTWQLRQRPALGSTAALLPGLSLGLLPSLLRTLGEPTSVRALILGLCALGVLALGVVLRLSAPLLSGSLVVAVLAVLNVAPYASALPRWVTFAAVGAGLLFSGLTWESRVNDVRAVGKSIQALR
ncbi:MAG: hypothetical protein ABI808_15540 [Pseudonocardiales bacterium]